jgi:hypothetical protein
MAKINTGEFRTDVRGDGTAIDFRLATVNRVARLLVGEEAGLARIHRISNSGVELSSIMELQLWETIQLDLSETVSLRATAISKDGKRYALAFEQQVNCADLLRQLVAEARSSWARPLRLATPLMIARGWSQKGSHQLELENISQRGMKVRHDGSFEAGLRVCIQLPNGRECRGLVRWTKESAAGLQLVDFLSADELGAVARLLMAPPPRPDALYRTAPVASSAGHSPT